MNNISFPNNRFSSTLHFGNKRNAEPDQPKSSTLPTTETTADPQPRRKISRRILLITGGVGAAGLLTLLGLKGSGLLDKKGITISSKSAPNDTERQVYVVAPNNHLLLSEYATPLFVGPDPDYYVYADNGQELSPTAYITGPSGKRVQYDSKAHKFHEKGENNTWLPEVDGRTIHPKIYVHSFFDVTLSDQGIPSDGKLYLVDEKNRPILFNNVVNGEMMLPVNNTNEVIIPGFHAPLIIKIEGGGKFTTETSEAGDIPCPVDFRVDNKTIKVHPAQA